MVDSMYYNSLIIPNYLPEINKDQLINIINEENSYQENTVPIRLEGDTNDRMIRFLNVIDYYDPLLMRNVSYANGETVFKLINLKGIKPFKYFISKNGYILSLIVKDNKTKMLLMSNKLHGNRESIALSRDKSLPNPNKDPADNHYYTSIHKLVKLIWDPNDLSYKTMLNPIIKHLDGNNYNNNVNNLVWVEKTEHNMFGEENERYDNFKSVDEIKRIAEMIKNNPTKSVAQLARELGVVKHKVLAIKFGESWTKYTGISKGYFERAPTPRNLTDEEFDKIVNLIQEGKTNVEIAEIVNVPLYDIGSIRNKKTYADRTDSLNFIKVSDSYFQIPVVGNKGDDIVKINEKDCKVILLNNVIPHMYYVDKEGNVYIVNWNMNKAKLLHMDEHVNGKKVYNQYFLRRKEGNFKDRFVVCKEDLVLYFWNPPKDYRPKVFDMLEAGNRDTEKHDLWTGEKLKRPSPMTKEDAEKIAKYITEHPDASNKEMSKLFGFSDTAIGHLKSGDTFKDITEKYGLKQYVKTMKERLTDEQVVKIANYIVSRPEETNITVAEKFNVSKHIVVNIRSKRNYKHLLDKYDFGSKPRQSFSYSERCDICRKYFVEGTSLTDIAKMYNRNYHIIKNFVESKFAEGWKNSYYANAIIPQFQQLYFASYLINIMNNGKGVTPFDVQQNQQYAPITGPGITPFDLKH